MQRAERLGDRLADQRELRHAHEPARVRVARADEARLLVALGANDFTSRMPLTLSCSTLIISPWSLRSRR